MRQKRTAQVKAHITPDLREQLELFVQEEGSVLSMSDYLFEVIEQHVAVRQAMRRPSMRASNPMSSRRVRESTG